MDVSLKNEEHEILRLTKILVPLDGSPSSERGLQRAIYFARICNSTITAICVAQSSPTNVFESVSSIDPLQKQKIQAILDDAQLKAAKSGIDLNYEILLGDPAKEISDYCERWNYELVIIGSRRAGTQNDPDLIGSIANDILTRTNSAIMIVK